MRILLKVFMWVAIIAVAIAAALWKYDNRPGQRRHHD